MHELSLMEAVRDQALAAAHADGASRITAISLRVGELAGVEIEALRFAFPVVMAGTIAAGAELRIEREPAECHCAACNAAFPAPDGCCDCPRCGAISLQLLRGRDLRLLALEVV
ncbi:MAG: hydrogenase maturation nickel metallochaperone HypA [Prochlorococcaceae cyanobacterium]